MPLQRGPVRITIMRRGEPSLDLELQYPLRTDHAALLRDMHAFRVGKGEIECRMHDDDPELAAYRDERGRVRGAWMYLRTKRSAGAGDFQLELCHWPDGVAKGSHAIPSPMTPEHRHRQEYIGRRGEDSGYAVEYESVLARGTRTDVAVRGPTATLAAEVQQSGITLSKVLERTRKVLAVGATPAWFADHRNPSWAFKVPHVETNERLGMARGTWTVTTGPRMLISERCQVGSEGVCPTRGPGRWCGRTHVVWRPMHRLTVDAIVEMVPDGGLVHLDTRSTQGVVLARPGDRDLWWEEHPPNSSKRSGQYQQHRPLHHPPYTAEQLMTRLGRPPSTVEEVLASAGIVADAVAAYLQMGRVRLDGCIVTDPSRPATMRSRLVII